jgi:acyl-CoA synthetase (AMP-forming)/AMP-acid ligase II
LAERVLEARLDAQAVEAAGATPERVNIAALLSQCAAELPERDAVLMARGHGSALRLRGLCYAELDARSNRIARGLRERGLAVGDRVCLFVRPGIELIALTFGLLKAGAVPVLIDPGMGRKSLLSCVERMAPRAFIGIPLAHVLRRLFPRAFRTIELSVTVGPRLGWGGVTLGDLLTTRDDSLLLEDTAAGQEAAILFTSGSTGPAKGVTYTHGNFFAQVQALRALYDFGEDEVDAACFPLFALFSPGLRMTCVFPELDPSRPARCDPAKIVDCIQTSGATSTFGSPAIWRRVVPWCIERGVTLPSLRRVLVAGAPVPPSLVEGFHRVLVGDADVHTPYGATESLPVSTISGREILARAAESEDQARGTCVGYPAPGVEVELIRVDDGPIETWSDELRIASGQLGEICVRGPVVTREYKHQPQATRLAKIGAGTELWHRIGDLGRLDDQGRLWFCGRKSHRLSTAEGIVPPVPTELSYNSAPDVRRTALVGVGENGKERAVLVVEAEPGRKPRGKAQEERFAERLREHVRNVRNIAAVEAFLFHSDFPVDVRHNAKIHRGELRRWAEARLS